MSAGRRTGLLRGLAAAVAALGAAGTAAALALSSPDGEARPDRGDARAVAAELRAHFAPKRGTTRVEAVTSDDGGAMPWAVRSWITRDASNVCAQLGRVVDGRFGTVGADGQFRPLRRDEGARCNPGVLDRGSPIVAIDTFVDDPQAAEPRPVRTVVWGVTGPRGRSVVARGRSGPRRLPLDGRRRSFVGLHPGAVRTYEIAVTVRSAGRRPMTLDYGTSRRRRDQPRDVGLEATAPDPAGGPLWGLLAWDTAGGRRCSYDGRVIAGGRVGVLHGSTFFDFPVGEGGRCVERSQLTRRFPFAYGVGSGRGRPVVLSGIAAPDVERIVLDGVGERREVEPGPRGGVLAIYPPGARGLLTPTAIFEDGSTRRLPGLGVDAAEPDLPGQSRVGALGPRTLRLSRGGLVTVELTCPCDRRARKCMGLLRLRTAEPIRTRSGLRQHANLGARRFAVGAGRERRRLRIRLPGRARALVERVRRLDAVLAAYSDAGEHRRPQQRRVTILAPARVGGRVEGRSEPGG